MDDWKKKILQREGYKLFRLLDLEPQLRGGLFSRGLITENEYQKLQALYDDGEKIKAAEMCLIRCVPHAKGVGNDECPFDLFVNALEENAHRGGSSSNGDVAEHLRKAASVVESGQSSGLSQSRSQSLELNRYAAGSSTARTPRKFCSEPNIPRAACRAVCAMLVIWDTGESCTPYLLEPYCAALGCEGQPFTCRQTRVGTPYSHVTIDKDVLLYGRVEVHLIGCQASDDVSTGQLLQEVFQNVTKPPCGVILLLDVCQSVETVLSELSRLNNALSCANLSQVRSVIVPAATSNPTGGSYQGAPESQEQIRHRAIELGIRDFCSNLSDAIRDILSHFANDSIAPDCEESHKRAISKAALRSRYQRRHNAASHSGSISDTESRSSDGSDYINRHLLNIAHGNSSYSPGMRPLRSSSSAHSVRSLPPIAQSPPEEPNSFLADPGNCEPDARGEDSHHLPFGSHPSDSLENMASMPPMLPVEPVDVAAAQRFPSTKLDCGRGESNREQELCCTVRPTTEVEGALVISLPRAMTESAPARMGTSSWIESEATSGGHGFRPQRRRRCTIL